MLAAVKACGPGAVLSHRSAGELWEFLDAEDRRPEVTVLGPGTRLAPGIVVHRTSQLAARDRTRYEGIPVTTPARTLIDLAAALTEAELRHAVRRAQGLRRVNTRQLLEVIGRLGPRRGSRRLSEAIATGPAPTRSALEDAVLDLLLRAGFEHPDVNRPLVIEGRRVIPDFRWPEQRLVLEADGAAWHDNAIARADDLERQALLEASGERVIRVTWHQAVTRSGETVNRIRVAGAPCRPLLGRARAVLRRLRGMRRSDQRRDAVFALYQREVTGRPLAELLEGAKPFTRELAEGADAHIPALDEEIARLARGWELDRIASLERNIMRVALYEMRHRDEIPVEVAIDEAVNLAKEYCGADAPGFVNGILGSAARELEEARQ